VVDEWIIVNEEEISAAVRDMVLFHRKIVEGAAGVALAAFLKDKNWRDDNPSAQAVVVVCGSNIDFASLTTILSS
jgi:threonine dehydratase